MNKINKVLLIGNVILILVVLSFVLTACSSNNSQISSLQQTDQTLLGYINQLQNKVNTDEAKISQLQAEIETMQSNFSANFNNLAAAINAK
jgi:peptidoglycan hydrolase CwlO-like protein